MKRIPVRAFIWGVDKDGKHWQEWADSEYVIGEEGCSIEWKVPEWADRATVHGIQIPPIDVVLGPPAGEVMFRE